MFAACRDPILRLLCALLFAALSASASAQVVAESPEIVFSGDEAQPLRDRAAQLGTAVAIYEFVHNTVEFAPYHGSRSGSINTFLGQRGSDVDTATTLIAMLRSRNIPARYAVGTVRIPAAQLTNWLGIPNLDVAVEVLKDHGVQGVVPAADRSSLDMEHAWAEVFVPFDQYRGINTASPAVDCSQSANASRCTWVPLDASFKQKIYNGLNLDPYNAISFDYTGYYRAIQDATTDPLKRKDKNPLTILEEQIGSWLRTNHPGKTLEDVEDAGRIVELREGLLPASLPYEVVGNVRRYDTVAAHDAAVPASEPKKWGKTVRVGIRFVFGGLTIQAGGTPVLLAEVNTKRLTMTTEFVAPGNVPNMVVRLGGTEISRPISGNGTISGFTPTIGYPFTILVSMDGSPGATSGEADFTISAEYSAIVGGYYLVATGGESSNWSQVHRAADQLLAANDQYKIVLNSAQAGCLADGTNCTPYVDANGNGWDATDTRLLETKPALDALTGGLLYSGAMQYYAKVREQMERADRLMKVRTPVIGFLGVVSSVYEAEYIDGTAFSILPGGLLIDMKGMSIGGAYRTNEPTVASSNRQFEFIAHIGSSLEHEIWQELTGYDAVSTVRGIQMALANGATLLNPRKNASEDTLPGLYPAFGFSTTVPATFTYAPYTVFATAPATWSHATAGASFDTFLSTVNTSTNATQRLVGTYSYYANSGLYGWSRCVANQVTTVNSYPPTTNLNGTTCDGTPFSGTPSAVLSVISNDWSNTIIPNYIGRTYFDYFDRNKGFSTSGRVFRTNPAAVDAQDTLTIASIRDDLYLRDTTQSWVEYVIPSKLTTGATYRFSVDIQKDYATAGNRLIGMSMSIANRSFVAGGGYVGLDTPALAADKISAKGH